MARTLFVCVFLVAVILLVPAPAAAQSKLDGQWHFVLDTPGGDREMDAVFKVEGDQVGGKWADKDDVKGTYSDGEMNLNFEITPEETGEKGLFVVKGKLDGDTMAGTWEFGEYKGDFKATRKKQ